MGEVYPRRTATLGSYPRATSAAPHAATMTSCTVYDHVRPYEQNMYPMYQSIASPSAVPLADFQVFKKGTIYGNPYNSYEYDSYPESEIETSPTVTYQSLLNLQHREYGMEDWKYKNVQDWCEEDTVNWVIDIAQQLGYSEFEFPYFHFRISGPELKNMSKNDMHQRIAYPHVDSILCRRLVDALYDSLLNKISVRTGIETSVLKYAESDPFTHAEASQTMLDLDSVDNKQKYTVPSYKPYEGYVNLPYDSSDAEDLHRSSPEFSDGSRSDEDEKRKPSKRPPGRPRGSGKSPRFKRARNVPVPEFLRNLLLDHEYCPSIIKWEDYKQGKFRFVNPDAVAKLWGKLKHNDNMTFEKFSRAMRYHYRQDVLKSVPSARLVYQFGLKGPDYRTDDPNFENIKREVFTPV